jgi:hypothetical protein
MSASAAVLAVLVSARALAQPGLADIAATDDLAATRVSQEHRYRLSAAIRPLLFWVGAKNVGGARIVWREGGEGRRGYELLLGSDPARAPRRINRWGFVREDAGPWGGTMFGVMNRSEDDSLGQATNRMAQEVRDGRFLFKLIRARVEADEAQAESTTVFAPQDFTFRQLDELQRYAESSRPPPRVRTGRLPAGTRPGLLFAIADLVGAGVQAVQTPGIGGLLPRTVRYTFNAAIYALVLTSWERVERARYGGRTHERLVRLEFESRNLEKRTAEHFVLVCATEGPLSGVPVFVQYQPKWWFKVEGVLDEGETL